MQTTLLVIYCLLILSASFLGGRLPLMFAWTAERLHAALAFVGGLMLGVAVLHLLPHSVFYTGSIDSTAPWVLGGLLGMFFLHRWTSFHQHDLPPADEGKAEHDHDHDGVPCGGHHHHSHAPALRPDDFWGWAGVTFGLGLHTLIDGVSLAAAVAAEADHGTLPWTAGIAMFLVIFLHKPFDAMAISTLLVSSAAGRSAAWRNGVNFGFALLVPCGVLLFHLGLTQNVLARNQLIGFGLGLAAGNFLFLAVGDLLQELDFRGPRRYLLSAMLLAGVGLAVLIGKLETSGHEHHRPAAGAGHDHGHSHDDHDHAGHDHAH